MKKAAREEGVTTWREMGDKTGQREMSRLTHQDKLTLLETAENKTLPGSPLWSVMRPRKSKKDTTRAPAAPAAPAKTAARSSQRGR
ncbi:hypothetical protein OHA33_37505 [Streptomyces sp. NBC_00562]|uniref:hypothetical protein n=1 Tax=Streptomyces sp. NBC_00562 TaxID=2975777 RepID=UPI002E81A730|nr:hypothetical protein [Streptomyces sp. NBC_00562]WUC24077.1 hypothetical protein OHA33_37505 [Streptomyces sp. NBC_00562]